MRNMDENTNKDDFWRDFLQYKFVYTQRTPLLINLTGQKIYVYQS